MIAVICILILAFLIAVMLIVTTMGSDFTQKNQHTHKDFYKRVCFSSVMKLWSVFRHHSDPFRFHYALFVMYVPLCLLQYTSTATIVLVWHSISITFCMLVVVLACRTQYLCSYWIVFHLQYNILWAAVIYFSVSSRRKKLIQSW